MALQATLHASAVLVGARAVLIRGPSGSGKSKLARELIESARGNGSGFARLVGDDRVHLETASGRLLVRPAQALAGLLEVRGVGVLRVDHEPVAVVGFPEAVGGDRFVVLENLRDWRRGRSGLGGGGQGR